MNARIRIIINCDDMWIFQCVKWCFKLHCFAVDSIAVKSIPPVRTFWFFIYSKTPFYGKEKAFYIADYN